MEFSERFIVAPSISIPTTCVTELQPRPKTTDITDTDKVSRFLTQKFDIDSDELPDSDWDQFPELPLLSSIEMDSKSGPERQIDITNDQTITTEPVAAAD